MEQIKHFKDNLNISFSNTSETHYKGDQHNDFNLSLQEGLWPENVKWYQQNYIHKGLNECIFHIVRLLLCFTKLFSNYPSFMQNQYH